MPEQDIANISPSAGVSLICEPEINHNENVRSTLSLWKILLNSVEWGGFVVGIITGLVVYLYTDSTEPSSRYFNLYQPSIDLTTQRPFSSYGDTIPYWFLIFFVLFFIVVLVVVEVVILPTTTSKSRNYRISTVICFLAAIIEATVLTLASTRLIKYNVGFLRPDFAHRCFDPFVIPDSVPVECTSSDLKRISEGMKSFPSGHSSTAAVLGWFISVSFCSTLHMFNNTCRFTYFGVFTSEKKRVYGCSKTRSI